MVMDHAYMHTCIDLAIQLRGSTYTLIGFKNDRLGIFHCNVKKITDQYLDSKRTETDSDVFTQSARVACVCDRHSGPSVHAIGVEGINLL